METNFQGFYQKSLHWRPRSPMETSVHNPASLSKMNRVLIKLYNLFMELIFQFRHKSVSFTRHKSELRKSHVKFSSFLLSLPLYNLPPAQTYKMQRGFVCRSLKADGPSLVLFHDSGEELYTERTGSQTHSDRVLSFSLTFSHSNS